MIKKLSFEWNLYIVKWKNRTMSVYLLTEEPEEINWLHLLDCEGDPSAAQVKRIAPGSGKWISFEQAAEDEYFCPNMQPEPSSIHEMFEESDELVWPE